MPDDHSRFAVVQAMAKAIKPFEAVVQPCVFGLENIPTTGPAIFVGNHTIYGILDIPFLMNVLLKHRNILLRGVADYRHFRLPPWAWFLRQGGAFDGSKDACSAMLARGECLLLYPGGGWEVGRRRHQKYDLVWKNRHGFVRLALAHGCPIVPVASVGVESAYDVWFDGDDLVKTRAGRWLLRCGYPEDLLMPLSTGIGWTPVPKPVRLYFGFGPPIEASPWKGAKDDSKVVRDLRDRVQHVLEDEIQKLRTYRRTDPYRRLLPRLRRAAFWGA